MKNKTGSDPATAHKDRKKNKNEHLINERQDANTENLAEVEIIDSCYSSESRLTINLDH